MDSFNSAESALEWAIGSIHTGVGIFLLTVAVMPADAQTLPFQSTERPQYGLSRGGAELPRGGFLEPRVESALYYADNLTLDETPANQVNTAGLELAPGIYASYSGDDFTGAVDYSLIGRVWEESDYDDVSHRLSANGRWSAVRDLLYVDGDARYFDTVVAPSAGVDYGSIGIFGRDQIAETATASIAPALRKRFGDLEVFARYSYGRVWYLDTPDDVPAGGNLGTDDSTDQAARFSLGTADADRALTGRIYYEWDQSEFQESPTFKQERFGFEGGWRVTQSVTIVGDVGRESQLDESISEGGLDDDFWHGGLRWDPDERTSAEVRYGQRFFGDSYLLRFKRQARILTFVASYTEEPTVDNVRLSAGDFQPGVLPPQSLGPTSGFITTNPYVAKDAVATVTAEGGKTKLSASVFQAKRDYLLGPLADETGLGGSLSATRRIAANLSGDFEAYYQDYERGSVLGSPPVEYLVSDYNTYALLRLNRSLGVKVTTSLESGYFNSAGAYSYDGWWVALRIRYVP